MRDFAIIVAMDEARGIGKGGVMPWHLPRDLQHFRDITTASQAGQRNAVIMGRKTWESIPERFRPLPDRLNVVVTAQQDYSFPSGVMRCDSLLAALEFCSGQVQVGNVFVIGGARVFAEALQHPSCRKLYLTVIEGVCPADVFFPEVPVAFARTSLSGKYQENGKIFSFSVYEK